MGKLKEACIEHGIEITNSNDFDKLEINLFKKILKAEIINIIKSNKTPEHPQLKEFLTNVIPISENNKYYLFISKNNIGVTFEFSYKNYINAMLILSQYEYNLFYTLTSFNGWIKEENATEYKALFVDIDDTLQDISNFGIYEIKSMLINDYSVSEEFFPDYVVKSGHGLHLVFLTEQMTDKELRQKYEDRLITYFGGDVACRKLYHYIRVPTSYNCKNEAVKSELLITNLSHYRNLNRLDFFDSNDDDINQYYKMKKAEKTAKMLATKARNGTLHKQKPYNILDNPYESEELFHSSKQKASATLKLNDTKPQVQAQNNTCFIPYYKDFVVGQHNCNLIKDLNNYYFLFSDCKLFP